MYRRPVQCRRNQPIGFNIITGNGTQGGTNVFVTAKVELTSTNAVLHYTAIATATQQLSTISITPRIWRQEPSGDVLVYTSTPTTCSATSSCSVEGTFTPHWDFNNATGTFFANVTTIYTLPTPITTAHGSTISDIATIYQTGGNEPVPEVVVTGELSPLELGKIMDPANANNTVPWGGTIEHGMDGEVPTTVVYDANGNPQFFANNDLARAIAVPDPNGTGYLPGTMVHEIPSGAVVDHFDENKQIVTHDNAIVYTEINHPPKTPIRNQQSSRNVAGNDCGYPGGYILRAENWNVNQLDKFVANWKVPSSPTLISSQIPHTMFLFNGIEPNPVTTILQPVLEWDNSDTGKYWTLASWDCHDTCPHSARRTVAVGDVIIGAVLHN